jgi:Flp pilus assembly CpaE family ATPase
MPDPQVAVLLIDSDAGNIEVVAEALEAAGDEYRLELASALAVGLAKVDTGEFDIILLHLPLSDAAGFEAIEIVLDRAKGVPVIVIGRQDDAELALIAVRAGAHDYLVSGRLRGPSLLRCIRHAVERQRHTARLIASSSERVNGRIVSFLGVKGGVGSTTSALNVAGALSAMGKQVIAAEVCSATSFAIHLRRARVHETRELMVMDPANINARLVDAKLTALPFGFRALFGPTRIGGVHPIAPESLREVLNCATELAEFVIVDLPSLLTTVHKAVLEASDFVALVAEPDPLSLEFTGAILHTLDQWGMDMGTRGLLVVNRAGLSNSLRPQDMRSNTQCDLIGILPAAGEACQAAFTANKLLINLQPDSRYSQAIMDLAGNLAQNPVGILSV